MSMILRAGFSLQVFLLAKYRSSLEYVFKALLLKNASGLPYSHPFSKSSNMALLTLGIKKGYFLSSISIPSSPY